MVKVGITYQKQKLKSHIEWLREEMIRMGIKEGFTSKRTIEISKRLDRSIVQYQTLDTFFKK